MVTDILRKETSVWSFLKDRSEPIVLYGMGDGADKVLAAFERFNIPVSGVIASDGFVHGQSFRGFKVKTMAEQEAQTPRFTIALCFASQLKDVMNAIKNAASRHTLVVPSVPVFGNALFNDDFLGEYASDIDSAYNLFADEKSKQVYTDVLKFYYTGDISLLERAQTDKSEAFENILKLGENEFYVDLGAYNGDTIDEFLHYSGGSYRKIVALEPNGKNFEKLSRSCEGMENVVLWQMGAYSRNTVLSFNNKAGRNSAISDFGTQTRVAAVDSILCGAAASYIKADVEGADYETLLGLENTIKRFKPKLNFSAYHRFEDLFRLPMLIRELNPEYEIYLRHHPYIPAWDTNLYCV